MAQFVDGAEGRVQLLELRPEVGPTLSFLVRFPTLTCLPAKTIRGTGPAGTPTLWRKVWSRWADGMGLTNLQGSTRAMVFRTYHCPCFFTTSCRISSWPFTTSTKYGSASFRAVA